MLCRINSIHINIVFIILTIILTVCTSCCVDEVCDSCYDSEASVSFNYGLSASGIEEFGIKGVNGNIEIVGETDSDSIRVWGEKTVRSNTKSDAEICLDYLEVAIQTDDDQIAVETRQPSVNNGRSYEVEYHIRVPEALKITAESVNGEMDIQDIQNDIQSELVNGQIRIMNVRGNCKGELVNGQIETDITLGDSETCILTSVNGNIRLDIPETTSARIEATVVSGTISLSGLEIQNLITSKTTASGIMGSGTGSIMLSTVNGNIVVNGN